MPKISAPVLAALRRIKAEADPVTGCVEYLSCVTPGTARAMERRGLITCDARHSTYNVALTDAGRAALSQ